MKTFYQLIKLIETEVMDTNNGGSIRKQKEVFPKWNEKLPRGMNITNKRKIFNYNDNYKIKKINSENITITDFFNEIFEINFETTIFHKNNSYNRFTFMRPKTRRIFGDTFFTEDEKETMTNILTLNAESIINKLKKFLIETLNIKIINNSDGFKLQIIYDNSQLQKEVFGFLTNKLIDKLNIIGDYQIIANTQEMQDGIVFHKLLYARPQTGVDWRPNETTPEDYYAL